MVRVRSDGLGTGQAADGTQGPRALTGALAESQPERMNPSTWTGPTSNGRRRDVVASLPPGPGALSVARAAVREAATRAARVCFVQIIDPQRAEEDAVAVEAHIFSVALRALRAHPRVPVTFEVTRDADPGRILVERCANSLVLVLGADDERAAVRHAQRHAGCDVLTVRLEPTLPLSPPERETRS